MVKILSDSTCDLSQDLLKKYDISILPLHVMLGEKDFRDGVDIRPDDIFRWSDEHKSTPKTAAPTIEEAVECMRPLLQNGDELLCFAITGGLRTCFCC